MPEVVIASDTREFEYLVDHFAMLAGHTDPAFETRVRLQRVNHWEQLDRFRPRADDR